MFEIITNLFLSAKVKERQLQNELKEQEFVTELLESSINNTNRLKQQFEDEDEAKWMEAGNNDEKQLSEMDLKTMIRQAQLFYYKNPHARGIVRLYEKYVVGRGFQMTPKAQDERWKEVWEDFWKENKMDRRRKEIIRRSIRDGECFIRFFYGPQGKTKIRFMNPLKVEDPNQQYSYGIQTNFEDIEDVQYYFYGNEKIPADQVIHEKILVDSDVKRGRSMLEVIARPLAQYKDWLNDRMKLNKIRAVLGLIKRIKGTSVQAENIASGQNTVKKTAPDGSAYHRLPEGVSVITATQGIDYEFKTPNLQASDVQQDGYALLNMIAAGPGLPNWMITSDPSNSNYASTMISEAPGVKEFQDAQDWFASTFEMIYDKVMAHALNAEAIPEKEAVTEMEVDEEGNEMEATKLVNIDKGVHIVFPELVHRDIFAETKALTMQRNEGAISLHTYSGRLDLDYDEEQEMIKQEQEEKESMDIDTEEVPEIPDIPDLETDEAFRKARGKYLETIKRKTVRGYLSPEPGDITERENEILAETYASARESGNDRETSAKIAWNAVKKYRAKKGK